MTDLLKPSFFERSTECVARELLGMTLVRSINNIAVAGIIIETEAYGDHEDAASHTARGKTDRNQSMFGPVGHTYVYKSYGIHHCLNIVARDSRKQAGGVLIRALMPTHGIDVMRKRRGVDDDRILTNGPGKIGQAFALSVRDNGINVTQTGHLYICSETLCTVKNIIATPRIGISKNTDILWRFVATIVHN